MSSPQLPHFVRVKGEDELEVNLKACGLNNSSLWMSIHELQECLEQLPKRCQMKIDLSNNPDINDEGLECLVNFLDEHSSWVPRLKVAGTGMSGAGVAQLTSFIQRGGVQELDLSRLSSVDQAHVLDLLSTIRESGCYPQGKALPLLLQMDQNGLVDPEGIVAQAREMDVCCEVLSSQKELTEAQAKRAAAKSGASGETEIMVSLLFFYNQTPEPGSQPSSPSSPLKLKAKSAPEPPPPEKFTVPKAFSGKAEAPTIFPRSLGVPRPPEAPPPWDLLWGAAEAGKAAAMKHLETVFGSTTTPKSSGRVIPDMPSGPPPKTRPNAPRPSRAQWRSKSITPVPPPKTPPRSVSRDDLPPVPPPKPRTLEIPAFRPPPKPRPMAAMPSTNSDPPAGKKLTEVLMEVARNNDQATMGDKVISAPAGLEARRLLEKFTKKDSSSPARSQASSTSNKEESSLKWQSSTWHVQEWWKDWKKSDEQAACNPSKEEWSNDWNKSDEQAAWSSSKEESSWKNGSSSGKRWWEEAEKTQDSSSKGEKEWWNEWQKSDEQAAWNLSKEEWSNDWNKSDEQVAWSSSKEESSSWKNWSSEDWIKSSSGKQWWEEAEKTQDSSSKGEKEWWNEWQKSDEQAAWNLSKEETPGAMSDDADDVEEAVLGRHLLLLSDDDGRIESTPIPSSKDSIDSKNDLAERQQEHELGSFMALLKQCVSENEVNDDSGGSDQETTRRESPYDTYNDNDDDDDDDDDDESDEDEDPNAMAIAQNSRAIIDRLCGRQVRPSSSLPGKRGVSPGGPKEPPFPPPNKKRRTAATLRRNKARTKTHTIDGLKKMEEVEVSKLRYSQRSCKDKFQCGRSVEQLVKQLCSGEVSTSAAFLRLTVFEVVENGVPVLKCIDNRRLWALKEYAKRSGRKNVKVKIDLFSYDTLTQVQRFMMNSDDTDGRRVRLRKSPQEKRR